MKRTYWLAILLLFTSVQLFAQHLNTTLRDNLDYAADLNDVWGYVAPDGTEYALVGLRNGLSIVSLADPDNIVEVAFIGGDNSTWRDMKTYGDYAYVVADTGNDGLLIVDLTGLPGAITHQFFNLDPPGSGVLNRAHNIFIDQSTGLAYISGANVNSGGMLIYDVATNPGMADFVALAPNTYSHDVYVQDDRMYASEINVGELNIYDVSDPTNITSLGTQTTPFAFTHNAWTTADGNYVFTTDERSNASTAAYDITNPADPTLIDEFRPYRSLNQAVIPHNTHVLNEYLIISHYTDGIEIVDASVPGNMIEVGYYDTWLGNDGGFDGCWGAYPFLPSGLVLGTDISNGLYVIEVDYKRASRLKGTITNDDGGPPLNNVEVTVTSTLARDASTGADGFYQTGTVEEGVFDVTFSLAGFQSLTVPVTFTNGVEIVLDTFLQEFGQVAISGNITSGVDNSDIPDAEVRLDGENGVFEDQSDNNGNIALNPIFVGDYDVFWGKWAYENQVTTANIQAGSVLNLQLFPGYLDGFAVDQGWTTSATASTGAWERAIPIGTTFNGAQSNPAADVDGGTDVGGLAFVTGNSNGGVGDNDIDGGTVTLTSPVLDLSLFPNNNLVVKYHYWFFNDGGSDAVDDEMTIALTNGTETAVLKTYAVGNPGTVTSAWTADSFLLADAGISLGPNLQVIITAGDTGSGHLVEAGFDNFQVTTASVLPVTLVDFTARPTDEQQVQLDWSTLNETANAYFQIERSFNNRAFTSIGRVVGAGNSQTALNYQFVDQSPQLGDNFYRLKQVDIDGTYSYSPIRFVALDRNLQQSEWNIAPNPTQDFIQLTNEVAGQVRVYNQFGQVVLQTNVVANQAINVQQLPVGQYWLSFENTVLPFVKQ